MVPDALFTWALAESTLLSGAIVFLRTMPYQLLAPSAPNTSPSIKLTMPNTMNTITTLVSGASDP